MSEESIRDMEDIKTILRSSDYIYKGEFEQLVNKTINSLVELFGKKIKRAEFIKVMDKMKNKSILEWTQIYNSFMEVSAPFMFWQTIRRDSFSLNHSILRVPISGMFTNDVFKYYDRMKVYESYVDKSSPFGKLLDRLKVINKSGKAPKFMFLNKLSNDKVFMECIAKRELAINNMNFFLSTLGTYLQMAWNFQEKREMNILNRDVNDKIILKI
jgi:hypothetical protein